MDSKKEPKVELEVADTPAEIGQGELTERVDLPFGLGKWQDFTQWRCKLCPYDTLDGEDVFWEHYASRHASAPEQPATIPVYNRFGNLVS